MNSNLKQISPGVLLMTTVAVCLPAPAGVPNDAVPQATVSYADLDLSRADGVERLYRRLEVAATIVCQAPDPRLASIVRWTACKQRALERAVAAVSLPALSRLHTARTGN
jgi:UrcA family protein